MLRSCGEELDGADDDDFMGVDTVTDVMIASVVLGFTDVGANVVNCFIVVDVKAAELTNPLVVVCLIVEGGDDTNCGTAEIVVDDPSVSQNPISSGRISVWMLAYVLPRGARGTQISVLLGNDESSDFGPLMAKLKKDIQNRCQNVLAMVSESYRVRMLTKFRN